MSAERLKRVEDLYHAALARPAEGRAAFLVETCGDDHDLRDEVLSLLAHAESADGFLEHRPAASSRAPALVAGARLGPYEIVAPIGAGGMGEVYRARDTRLGRTVAIKVLPRHSRANALLLARFKREARAIARLNHPHICTLHDIGHHDDIDFLVLEHVEGETLHSRLRSGPLPVDETVHYAREVADALAAAHHQGLVHRDIKPANILITTDGRIKVVDFGLATLFNRENPMGLQPTEPGVLVGTPSYMSPEQVRGQPLDPQTDFFSLGVVMFECLTGRLPFDGETRDEYLQQLLSAQPRAIRELRADVPVELQALVARCLEWDVSRRIGSAAAVMAELDLIAGGGVAGPATGPARPPRLFAAVAIAAVPVAAAALLFLRPFAVSQPPQGTAGDSQPLSSPSRHVEPVDDSVGIVLPGTDVTMPEVRTRVLPRYPIDGASENFRGVIDVEVVVRPDGRVAHGRVTRWPTDRGPLVEETLDALRQWLFSPALGHDGAFVWVLVMVQFGFEPPSGRGRRGSVSAQLRSLPRFSESSPELFATAVELKTPGLQPPIPLRKIQPTYPSATRESGIRGRIYVDIVVLPDGSVGAVGPLTWPADPALPDEVIAAAGRWLFEPGILDGKQVATKLTLDFVIK